MTPHTNTALTPPLADGSDPQSPRLSGLGCQCTNSTGGASDYTPRLFSEVEAIRERLQARVKQAHRLADRRQAEYDATRSHRALIVLNDARQDALALEVALGRL